MIVKTQNCKLYDLTWTVLSLKYRWYHFCDNLHELEMTTEIQVHHILCYVYINNNSLSIVWLQWT